MYAIANVVLGTIRPWSSPGGAPGLDHIRAVLDVEYKRTLPDEWTEDDASHYAANPDLIGVQPTDAETAEARAVYDTLPERVRAVLPPFGLYILWSTS